MDAISAIAPAKGLADVNAFRAQRADLAYKAFESMYVQLMLKQMRQTVPGDGGIFPRSQATEMFEEMLDASFAEIIAESGQLGIARQLAEEAARGAAGARNEAAALLALESSVEGPGR